MRLLSATLPALALVYLPLLQAEQLARWPTMPLPSVLGAQVEQETCTSLTSKRCWSPTTELKTSREYGFGLGQLTRAYNKDGSVRFDAWTETKRLDRSLATWKWEDRYDPQLQLRALVVKDRYNFEQVAQAASGLDRLAFALSAYNGGLGGVINDRRLCQATKGCDPSRWFNHVELTSTKSRTKWHGYGQSAYDINRGYVENVLINRRAKYVPALGGR